MGNVTDIRQIKREMRAKYRTIREQMDPQMKQKYDRSITVRLTGADFYQRAKTVLCFVSTGIEVETREILEHSFAQGKTVAVPKCLDKNGSMDFFVIRGLDELRPSMFSLWEPDPSSAPKLSSFQQSICILPAFAFDRDGYRIGFGKGYYDRFLQRYSGLKVGVCYNSCIAETIPRGRFDAAADYIVTPKYIMTIKKEGDSRR